jgi:hypothetical protein
MAAAFAERRRRKSAEAEHAALDATKAALNADHERALGDSLAKVAALEAEFKDQADRAYAQLVERSDKLSAAEAALRDARDTSDAATLERAELKRELRELRSGWDAARGEMDSARLALDSARAESQALREELARAERRVRSLENESCWRRHGDGAGYRRTGLPGPAAGDQTAEPRSTMWWRRGGTQADFPWPCSRSPATSSGARTRSDSTRTS